MLTTRFAVLTFCAALLIAPSVSAQETSLAPFITVGSSYRATPDLTYLKVGAVESKLDVYQNRTATSPAPTLVWIHGGNWVGGTREAAMLTLLPFFQMGWNVVNVDYRLLQVAPAPAAAEDCRCAIGWVAAHARDYNIDPARIVVAGNSAGGHLSLLAAMAGAEAGLDTQCPGASARVAAVINWYGFPNLVDVLEGKNANQAVNNWIGQGAARRELARRLSPVTYVRAGGVPVLTIHGDADPTSAYEYAAAFHAALGAAGVQHQLLTIPGGKHGGFTDAETATIYATITSFLAKVTAK
ncbi:MAG: alpha/beta hydrolase fold domain-containing protein [Vicinamibacterales bacterium]